MWASSPPVLTGQLDLQGTIPIMTSRWQQGFCQSRLAGLLFDSGLMKEGDYRQVFPSSLLGPPPPMLTLSLVLVGCPPSLQGGEQREGREPGRGYLFMISAGLRTEMNAGCCKFLEEFQDSFLFCLREALENEEKAVQHQEKRKFSVEK